MVASDGLRRVLNAEEASQPVVASEGLAGGGLHARAVSCWRWRHRQPRVCDLDPRRLTVSNRMAQMVENLKPAALKGNNIFRWHIRDVYRF